MITAFSTAMSGLQANADAINVVGNDLANLNTTGYKSDQLHFQDVMSESLGVSGTAGQLGLGVGQVSATKNYAQGSLQTTNGATDAAIQGNGFFVLKDQNNQTLYTRDGQFTVNSTGQLVTSTGAFVQGYSATAGVINTNGAIGNLTLPLGSAIAATPTTSMSLAMNLNSSVATTDPGATVSAPIQIYDSLGSSHTLTATFTKTGANAWSYSVTAPASDLAAGGTTPAVLGTGTLTFDASGNLLTPAAPDAATPAPTVSMTGLSDGAKDMQINFNLYDTSNNPTITQYAEASGTSGTTQNGYAAGNVTSLALQNGGAVVAKYSNGQQITIGQLAMASINNPDTLTSVGNNNLQASPATGIPVIGAANTASRGQIVAGSIESSTVDISQEFTNLLTFQRSYQANSRVITTSDQILQETVNLIHA